MLSGVALRTYDDRNELETQICIDLMELKKLSIGIINKYFGDAKAVLGFRQVLKQELHLETGR